MTENQDVYLLSTVALSLVSFFLVIVLPCALPRFNLGEVMYIKLIRLKLFGRQLDTIAEEIFGEYNAGIKESCSDNTIRADSSEELHNGLKVELVVNSVTAGVELVDWIAKLRVYLFILSSDASPNFILNYSVFAFCLNSAMFLTMKNRLFLFKDIKKDINCGCRAVVSPTCGFLTGADVEVQAHRLSREMFSHRQSLVLMLIQEVWAVPLTLWFMQSMSTCNASSLGEPIVNNFEFLTCFGSVCLCFSLIGSKVSLVPQFIEKNASVENCINLAKLKRESGQKNTQERRSIRVSLMGSEELTQPRERRSYPESSGGKSKVAPLGGQSSDGGGTIPGNIPAAENRSVAAARYAASEAVKETLQTLRRDSM